MAKRDDTMRDRARQLATEVGLFGGLHGAQVQFLTTVIVMFAENEMLRRMGHQPCPVCGGAWEVDTDASSSDVAPPGETIP